MPDPTPMSVAVIGGTGDGGPKQMMALTPAGEPNLIVTVVGPFVAVAIRFVNLYLTLLVGIVTAGMTTNLLPVGDFVALLQVSAKLAIAGSVVGLLKDLVTVFGKLEQKYPLLTGQV